MNYFSDDLAYVDVPYGNRVIRYVRSADYDDWNPVWEDDDGQEVNDDELYFIVLDEKGVKFYDFNDKVMPKSKAIIPEEMQGRKHRAPRRKVTRKTGIKSLENAYKRML